MEFKFKQMDEIQKRILMEVADLHTVPEGAFNIRKDGEAADRKKNEYESEEVRHDAFVLLETCFNIRSPNNDAYMRKRKGRVD